MNNRSIPSMHAERKITDLFDLHSFTPHPSLSPYRQTELWRNKYTRCAWARGTFFPVVLLCQFFVLAGNRFRFYLLCTFALRVQYSCGVVLVFWFWREIVFGVMYVLTPPPKNVRTNILEYVDRLK
jgi:hypothetical protein